MQIAFHIGANCTDEDRLLKSVLKNADMLMQQGIVVPGPSRYRSLIRETIQGLGSNDLASNSREILLENIVEHDNVRRIVLSNDNFICIPKRIFDHGVFYPQAETKVRGLHHLFPDDRITLYLSIRNPVTFLQETFRRSQSPDLATYLGLMPAEDLRWSDVIKRIRAGAPDTPLIVWCNEDSPLLWEQLIRLFSGASTQDDIAGGLDMLSTIITETGMRELARRFTDAPPQNDIERHETIADIWEAHAIPDEIEDEINLFDLDHTLITQMTEMYESDLETIAQMDGVTLILPFC